MCSPYFPLAFFQVMSGEIANFLKWGWVKK